MGLIIVPCTRAIAAHVVEVKAGANIVYFRYDDGTVWWRGTYGVFNGTYHDTLAQVPNLQSSGAIGATGPIGISWDTDDGGVYRWGNVPLVACFGTTYNAFFPGVSNPNNAEATFAQVKTVIPGFYLNHVLLTSGVVWRWGTDVVNPCQVDKPPAVQEGLPTNITALAGGVLHYLALDPTGVIWSWGVNYYGELGGGTSGNNTDRRMPAVIPNLNSVKDVGAGDHFSVALKTDGTVWTWVRTALAS